jgi:hypothetical protein
MATHHKHSGGVQRKSKEPPSAATNRFANGVHGASAQLDTAPNMNMPGGGAMPVSAGGPPAAGPGSPAPDASTQLPPGMPPGMMPQR